jgi:hypothetical protein
MNIKETKQALDVLMKHKRAPFLWGAQGIGKTETVVSYCESRGLDHRILHLSTQEIGDLIGLLMKNADGTVSHARPDWFPTSGKGIIFLDEFNLGNSEVLSAMFPFVQSGTLHKHQLPEGWRVVAAGNYNNENFTTTDISSRALISRFAHIDFTPTVEEWLVYAEGQGLYDIASFIRDQPSMLQLSKKDMGTLDMTQFVPDPRGNIAMAKIDQDPMCPDEIKYELFSGIVGNTAAAAFLSHKATKQKGLELREILSNYKQARKKIQDITKDMENMRLDVLNQPIDELFVKLEGNPQFLSSNGFLDNFKMFLLDIPIELSTKALVKLGTIRSFHGRNEILNNAEFAKQLATNR